jgi:hypothetical protein
VESLLLSCLYLAWLIEPWRCEQYVPSKWRLTFNILHCIISHYIITTAVKSQILQMRQETESTQYCGHWTWSNGWNAKLSGEPKYLENTGHGHLKWHFFKLGLTDDPTHERCLQKDESATHILCDCEAIAYQRYRHLGQLFMEPSDFYDAPVHSFEV